MSLVSPFLKRLRLRDLPLLAIWWVATAILIASITYPYPFEHPLLAYLSARPILHTAAAATTFFTFFHWLDQLYHRPTTPEETTLPTNIDPYIPSGRRPTPSDLSLEAQWFRQDVQMHPTTTWLGYYIHDTFGLFGVLAYHSPPLGALRQLAASADATTNHSHNGATTTPANATATADSDGDADDAGECTVDTDMPDAIDPDDYTRQQPSPSDATVAPQSTTVTSASPTNTDTPARPSPIDGSPPTHESATCADGHASAAAPLTLEDAIETATDTTAIHELPAFSLPEPLATQCDQYGFTEFRPADTPTLPYFIYVKPDA